MYLLHVEKTIDDYARRFHVHAETETRPCIIIPTWADGFPIQIVSSEMDEGATIEKLLKPVAELKQNRLSSLRLLSALNYIHHICGDSASLDSPTSGRWAQ
jgi:hypothetical protein